MTSITSKATAKVAAVATGLAMATSMLSLAPMAHAQSASASASCSVGQTNLTVGSSGPAVTCLQQTLIGWGFSIPAGATGYFGTQTRAAVAAWQASKNISPAAGYFGPISRGAFMSAGGGSTGGGSSTVPGCNPGDRFSSTTGQACGSTGGGSTAGLSGVGTLDDVNELGSYNNEDVAEGDEDVEVLGAELVVEDGDIALRSVRVSFDPTGNTGSDDLDDYIESVSVMLDGKTIGTADVEDFDQNSSDVWFHTIQVSGAVIDEGEEGTLTVAVDATSNIDSSDISGDSWTVDLVNIRYEDASGDITTDTSTGDIGTVDFDIAFVSFSTKADTELQIRSSGESPEAGVVIIDDVSQTDDVLLLAGELEAEGESDVVIDELPVTFSTTGGNTLVQTMTSITLRIGGEEYTETVSSTATSATLTFDDLDFTIEAGETVEFEILAEINDVDSGTLDEGDKITVSITATNRDNIDAENEEGDQLSDSTEKSGTATGEAQEFRTEGVTTTFVSASTSITAGNSTNDDLGTFTIRFKVTAVGETIYMSTLADAVTGSTVTTGKTSVKFDRAGTATTGGTSVTIVNVTDADLNSTGLYTIEEGETHTFEVTGTVQLPTSGSAGQYRMSLVGLSWDDDSTDALPDNAYTSNLDEYKTSYIGLN